MSAPEISTDSLGGEEFGKYTIYGKIAAGGMAAVFLGRERFDARRWVAIKRVHPHLVSRPDVVQMFLNEAKIVSRLEHSNICGIIDYGVLDESPYIVMRYLHGAPLSGLLRRIVDQKMELPVDLMAYVSASILEGLHYAHEAAGSDRQPLGLVHRDISPQNIFITFDGEVTLLDFGVAKAAGYTGFTRTGHIKGKYAYMSPEQVEAHPLDRRSDVFSLGIVLWEALAGKHLFRRKRHIDTLRAIANAEVPHISTLNPNVPHALETIVGKALAGDRRLRYQTAKAMGGDLFSYLSQHNAKMGPDAITRTMKAMFPERRHPADVPGMNTQSEVLALVTEHDAQAPDMDELPSVEDEGLVPSSHTDRDTLIPHEAEPPKPDSGMEPTEQLNVVMINDRLELAGHVTIPLSLDKLKGPRNSDDNFDEATIQLNMAPPLPPNDARATIPDQKIDLPPQLMFAQDTMIPAPTIVEAGESFPFFGRAVPEPTARPEKSVSPVLVTRKRSQAGPILAAALACAIGFGAYAAIVRWVRSKPAEPELVKPPKKAIETTPKIVPREGEVSRDVQPPTIAPAPAVESSGGSSSKKPTKAALIRARELEKDGRKALMNNELTKAEKMLFECTRLAPIPACYRSLGVLYAQIGDSRASILHYRKYLELAPNAADADFVRKILAESQ